MRVGENETLLLRHVIYFQLCFAEKEEEQNYQADTVSSTYGSPYYVRDTPDNTMLLCVKVKAKLLVHL